jgi:Ca-activated chloride channel family protein
MAATVVLVSDGAPSIGLAGQSPQQAVDTEAAAAKAAGVTVDTVACGTEAGAATLARIARQSGGLSFTARSASQLTSIYRGLGTVIGKVKITHDLTAWFTGAALAAACLAGAAGLRWSDRLIP